MRPIEFRGKDSVGNWRFGNLIISSYVKDDQIKYVYVIQGINDKSYCSGINEKTVGQFAGLFDKNGVDIYEGDIFDNGDKVIWHDCGFVIQNKLGKFPLWKSNIEGLKVIGNIHDNPELI